MDERDVERIARAALKELGAGSSDVTVEPLPNQAGRYRVEIGGSRRASLTIACGHGSTPQWVREQIVNQLNP